MGARGPVPRRQLIEQLGNELADELRRIAADSNWCQVIAADMLESLEGRWELTELRQLARGA